MLVGTPVATGELVVRADGAIVGVRLGAELGCVVGAAVGLQVHEVHNSGQTRRSDDANVEFSVHCTVVWAAHKGRSA